MFPSNSAASPPFPLLLPFEVSFTFITPTQVHDEFDHSSVMATAQLVSLYLLDTPTPGNRFASCHHRPCFCLEKWAT
jgi:hypothetical protein